MTQRDIKFLTIILLLFFTFTVIRNAWISDDAYITFRAVENFRTGNGMGYNPNVRVQSFTHPLWMLVLSAVYFIQVNLLGISFSAGLVFLALFLSMVFSVLTIALLINKCVKCDLLSVTLLAASVILSRAYLDYSTSGLENPLTNVLLAVFLWKFFEDSPRFITLVFFSALIALNRFDALLLVIALGYIYWLERDVWRKNLLSAAIGFFPLIFWEFFSLFYFGFPFPNTAYAKLNTGILDRLLFAQGFDYFLNSIRWGPLTLFVIVLAGIGVIKERNRKSIVVYLGALFYLFYVFKIGGDFMAGRFLAVVFLVAAVLLARLNTISIQLRWAVFAIVLVLGLFNVGSTVLDPQMPMALNYFELVDRNGIADERLVYFERNSNQGLVIQGIRDTDIGSSYAGRNWIFTKSKRVVFAEAIGKAGYKNGPDIYMVDYYALVDPLLARLPTIDLTDWRIGHFWREIPPGYAETLKTHEMRIADPDLALYYQKLSYVISGPLWDWERIREIWKFNTGQSDALIAGYGSRNP